MFQMYKVALSAGKAHRDHKHHHVHKFIHNGPAPETTPAPPTAVCLMHLLAPTDLITHTRIMSLSTGAQRSARQPTAGQRTDP